MRILSIVSAWLFAGSFVACTTSAPPPSTPAPEPSAAPSAWPSAPATVSPTPPTLAEGQTCGTRGVQGDCGQGLYCKYKSLCGATDSGGTCTKRPDMCTKIYRPVCGCDGKTHPSDCVAASEGTAVKHEGACKD